MKHKLTLPLISSLCLGIGFFSAELTNQALQTESQDPMPVASEYNPPGRGGAYPGGTRWLDQPTYLEIG